MKTNPETSLSEAIGRLQQAPTPFGAVLLRYSLVPPSPRRAQFVQVAMHAFSNFTYKLAGASFAQKNFDCFFFFPLTNQPKVQQAVQKLRTLFSDEGVFEEDGILQPFDSWFEVVRDGEELMRMARRYQDLAAKLQAESGHAGAEGVWATPKVMTMDLDSKSLSKIVDLLSNAKLNHFVRRQPVCAVGFNQPVQAVFEECYVSFQDLQATVCPTINIYADKWLFQYLTGTVDKRMLHYAMEDLAEFTKTPVSLNLNVETLLSKQFLDLDRRMTELAIPRGRVVVELQRIDIFSDFGGFSFARDFLLERGYTICVDGMTQQSLQFIDRNQLKVDFVKMIWSPELTDSLPTRKLAEMKELVKRTGTARLILTRCDNETALRFGRSAGISLFQGRYFDQRLRVQKISDGDTY
ncbi:MAG: EAL domain-containing protein [Alphaproteobacteria bacterium]|nr:EAL domain-containing protein [Alphaproteobacteria bacterium]